MTTPVPPEEGTPRQHFGPIRRCRVHDMADGCEASWPECLPELMPHESPTAAWVIEPQGATPPTGIIVDLERLHDSLPRHFGTHAELRDALNEVAAARSSAVRRNVELVAELERVTRERDEARTELDRLRPVAGFLARAGTHPSADKPDDPIEILEKINHPSLVKRLDEERRPLEAEIAAMRPVVEAAEAWAGPARLLVAIDRPLTSPSSALLDALDAYHSSGDTP